MRCELDNTIIVLCWVEDSENKTQSHSTKTSTRKEALSCSAEESPTLVAKREERQTHFHSRIS